MTERYSGYDHQEGLWTTWSIKENGDMTVLKKSKTHKEIKKFNDSKKALIITFPKKSHLPDHVIEENKVQKKINRNIKKGGKISHDKLEETEKLSNRYNYKTDEVKKIKKKKRLPERSTIKKFKASAFYHPSSQGGILGLKKKNYDLLNKLGKKLVGEKFHRVEVSLKIGEEKHTITTDVTTLLQEADQMKLTLGREFAQKTDIDETIHDDNVSFSVRGLL